MTFLEQSLQVYFGQMKEEELSQIASFFKKTTLSKNDFFLKEGKKCDKLSFIQSGMLRIFNFTGEKEVTQWISTTGYFVTDLSSFMFDSPARWSIQALSETEVFTISKSDYQQIGSIVPLWYQLEKMFLAKCFTMLEDRVYSHLSMSAEERYSLFFDQNRELFNQVPLHYIASMLGMTPETFSRIRKKQLL